MPSALLDELRELNRLPSIPGVALEVLDLIQSEDVSVPQLAAVLNRDPALVTKVLKTANSSMFGVPREVTRVDQAISLLGMRTVNLLALSFSLVPSSSSESFDLKGFWRFCATTTTAARFLAGTTAPRLRDESFLAGLLCRIGQMVLAEGVPDRYQPVLDQMEADTSATLCEVERELLDTTHLEVGAQLLAEWGLPPVVCNAIGGCDDPSTLKPGSQERELAQILRISARCSDLCFGDEIEAAVIGIKQMAAEYFNLDSEWCAELMQHIQEELPRAASLFEIELDNPGVLTEVCMRASQLVVQETLALNQQVQTATAQAQQLQQRATTDALTGLGNRGHFDDRLQIELGTAHGNQTPVALLLLDLDHFKAVNDTHGHQTGDNVLRSVGEVLRMRLPEGAEAFRYGGEEFAVLLLGATSQEAVAVAETVRLEIAGIEVDTASGPLRGTVSIGACWLERLASPDVGAQLIESADRALYKAKNDGRNRVELSSP